MAARKLQAEIDRTLKAVAAGVEVFDNTFEKLGMATNTTQKDKLETDLKTQIKKLQRMRDQIKAWLGNSDIKDKTALTDARKLIESQMERFKALEKEMKMKAFSKEGLIAQSKLDPAEKAKRDVIDWIGTTVDELSRQIEQTEAEMEAVQGGGGKKKKAMGEKLNELEELNERRVWHNSKLEIVQRMLENGQLSVDQVEVIQEDIKYFVEANAEEDFDYDDGIYEDLNLQEEDEYLQDISHNDDLSNLDSASIVDPTEASPPPPSVMKTPAKEEKKEKSTPALKTSTSTPAGAAAADEPSSPIQGKKQPSRKSTMDSTKAEPMIKAAKPAEPAPPVPSVPKTTLPPIRYAAAVAGPATAAATAAAVASGTPATVTQHDPVTSPSAIKTELPDLTPAASDPPLQEKELAAPAGLTSPPVTEPAPKLEPSVATNGHPPPPPPGLAAATSPSPNSMYQNMSSPFGAQAAPSPANYTQQQPQPQPQAQQQQQRGESSRAGAYSASPRTPHGVMGNLMHSVDMAKEISERRAGDLNELHSALDSSFNNAPTPQDGEPPRYYYPKNPIKTPSHYPQTRLPHLLRREMYGEYEADQLFYIFYYRTGTYEQWCVAEELKKQSWRFHKQYLTWFQRAHNPQAITEDYEQGGYLYFDWENSWCQRKKSDFRFEYRWLSDH